MSRRQLAALLIVVGVGLCVPAILVAIAFAGGAADVNAVNAAPACSTPTQDGGSSCLSLYTGTINAWTPRRKSLDRVTIAIGDTTVNVGYSCDESPGGACDRLAFKPGTPVVTGWWRGQMVVFGPAESHPAIVTELHPLDRLRPQTVLLAFVVISAVSFLLGGLLLLQAPSTVDELIKTALARWPDPPRMVDPLLTWRVALGYWTVPAYFAWFLLTLIGSIVLVALVQYLLAPLLLLATFVVSFSVTAVVARAYLNQIVSTSDRRAIMIQRIKTGLGKSGKDTEVWYDLVNGKTASTTLNLNWNGHIKEGDRLDALTDPASGSILRLLSTPPAQA